MDIFEENCDTENNCTVSYFWKGLALFLLGVIIGLFVSPIKKGVTIGCNNKIDKGGCNDHFDPDEYYDDYNFDDEDDFDLEDEDIDQDYREYEMRTQNSNPTIISNIELPPLSDGDNIQIELDENGNIKHIYKLPKDE